jgi:hypothetical protein
LLGECGVPVTKAASHRRARSSIGDDYQIVAKPEAAKPTARH